MEKRSFGKRATACKVAIAFLICAVWIATCAAPWTSSGRSQEAAVLPEDEVVDAGPTWLKVGSYNIFQGINSDIYDREDRAVYDIEAVAEYILAEDFDIIGLQEVNVNRKRYDIGGEEEMLDQPRYIAEYLTEKTGEQYYYCYGVAMLHFPLEDTYVNDYGYPAGEGLYGDAIISKYPIVNCKVVPMAFHDGYSEEDISTYYLNGNERRVLMIAEIQIGDERITFMNTHLDHKEPSARTASVDVIARELAEIEGPVILVGDLNSNYNSDVIERISEELLNPVTPLTRVDPTYPRSSPRRKIDWIFVGDGIGYRNYTVHKDGPSDHCMLSLEISLTEIDTVGEGTAEEIVETPIKRPDVADKLKDFLTSVKPSLGGLDAIRPEK